MVKVSIDYGNFLATMVSKWNPSLGILGKRQILPKINESHFNARGPFIVNSLIVCSRLEALSATLHQD